MKKAVLTGVGILFWLAVWQITTWVVDSPILLVSPIDVVKRLAQLIITADFWASVLFSSARIMLGFFLGLVVGTATAVVSGKFRAFRVVISPLISVMKSIPVASFTILALLWISSENLSVLVTFLICTPIVCSNMQAGIDSLDPKLKEMAKVFKIPALKRFSGVYLSQLMPHFRSAATLAIGLSWKSGAAAEVIGIPDGSIGEKLFMSKIYFETADMFAWTAAIILLSLLCEKVFLFAVRLVEKKIERM